MPTTTSTTPPPTSTSTTSTTLVGDITAVTGEADGYLAIVILLGGPPMTRPCDPPPAPPNTNYGPSPIASLPPTGGVATDTDPTGLAQIGPAVFLESGPVTVNASGTTGPTGSVTASASLVDVGPGPLTAEEMSSTCMASASGVSGSTTVIGGQVATETDGDGNPNETVPIPVNPEPNTAIEGTITNVGDNFRIVFNEQVVTQTSITVYAAHLYLLGPNAIGDLWIGKSECGVTGSGTGPTTTTSSSIPPTTTTSSTRPPTSKSSTSTSTSNPTADHHHHVHLDHVGSPPPRRPRPPLRTATWWRPSMTPCSRSRGQVRGTITCEAGTFFALELDLTQDDAKARAWPEGAAPAHRRAPPPAGPLRPGRFAPRRGERIRSAALVTTGEIVASQQCTGSFLP